MTATLSDIKDMIEEGQSKGATHVIIARDVFNNNNYPVFVMPDQDVREIKEETRNANSMSSVDEVYFLGGDIDAQLAMERSFTYE